MTSDLGRHAYVAAGSGTVDRVRQIAQDARRELHRHARRVQPICARRFAAPRIGLWDQYGGSMESGWTRWILEQFEFPFTRVFAPELDAGNLNAKYDVLIFPNGAIPPVAGGGGGRGGRGGGRTALNRRARRNIAIAARTRHRRAHHAAAAGVRRSGGTIVAIGNSATNLAAHFKLPVENHLVENGAPLPRAKYFVPGSVLSAKVDVTHPLAAGMRERADFFFDNSPVFKLRPDAAAAGVRAIAMFDTPTPLRSGWAWGQKYLDGGVVAVEARMGKGTRAAVRAGDPAARAAARHVQAAVQRNLHSDLDPRALS